MIDNHDHTKVCDQFTFDILAANHQQCKVCKMLKKEHVQSTETRKSFNQPSIRQSIKQVHETLQMNLSQRHKNQQTQQDLEHVRELMKGKLKEYIDNLTNKRDSDILANMQYKYATQDELEKLKQHLEGNIELKQGELQAMKEKWQEMKVKDRQSVGQLEETFKDVCKKQYSHIRRKSSTAYYYGANNINSASNISDTNSISNNIKIQQSSAVHKQNYYLQIDKQDHEWLQQQINQEDSASKQSIRLKVKESIDKLDWLIKDVTKK